MKPKTVVCSRCGKSTKAKLVCARCGEDFQYIVGQGEGVSVSKEFMSKVEKDLRRLLWLRHGCPWDSLYGDDGKMYCNTCFIDFKNDPPEVIEEIFRMDNLEKFTEKYSVESDEDVCSFRNHDKWICNL